MVAVRGIATLGLETGEVSNSKETLVEVILYTNDVAVKKVAIMTYLNISQDNASSTEYLKAILPTTDHRFVSNKIDDLPEYKEQTNI